MSQWDKMIEQILRLDRNLRFEDLSKALTRIGYARQQSKSGSSHYIFRKKNCVPITIPKHRSTQMDIVYIKIVRDAIAGYFKDGGEK